MQVSSFRVFATSLLLGAAACADSPSAPENMVGTAPATAAVTSAQGDPVGRVGGFLCYTSVRTPGGPYRYRYGRLELEFPRPALDPYGSTVQYRYRVQRQGEEPTRFASCVIPNTREAIRLTHAYFRVGKHAQVTERRRGTGAGEMTTLMCGRNGEPACELEAIEVGVEGCSNPDWTRGEDGVCRSDRGGGGSDGSGDGGWGGSDWGGGDSPDPGTPPKPCDTGDPVLDSPEMQDAMKDLWEASNSNAPEAERREIAGWIVPTSGGYAIVPATMIASGPCSMSFAVGDRPADAVGFIHTHPYSLREIQYQCPPQRNGQPYEYTGRLGPPDRDAMRTLNAIQPGLGKGYFIDKNGISKISANTRVNRTDARYGRCGY